MGKKGLPKKKKTEVRVTDLSRLSEYFTFDDKTKEPKVAGSGNAMDIEPFDIPQEFIGCDSIISNASDKCFLTPFSEEDVQFFLKIFQKELFKEQLKYSEKQQMIESSILNWRRHKGHNYLNPLEPILYALKLTDNILGSAKTAADPDPKLLDAFANGLSSCWNQDFEEDNTIICHILVNWDWYQPIVTILRMYQLKDGYNNVEIDEIIRRKKLFTPDYATVAFECLANHMTSDNAECLLKFISNPKQAAIITGAEIKVTKKQRELFENMYQYTSFDFQNYIKEVYTNQYRMYSDTKSRKYLDYVMNIEEAPSGGEILKRYQKYSSTNGEEQQTYYAYLAKYWDLSDTTTMSIVRGFHKEEILDLITKKLSNANGYTYGSVLWNLAQNKYAKAQKFVVSEISRVNKQDRKWLGCACANNLLRETPSMDEIVHFFFIRGNGYMYKNQLQWLTKIPAKSKEFRDALKSVMKEIQYSPDKWGTFFNSCQQLFYGDYITIGYPTEIDDLLKKAVEYSVHNSTQLVFDVLGVIENIIDRSNRDRYREMLHTIHYTERFPHSAKNRAAELMYKVYGGTV